MKKSVFGMLLLSVVLGDGRTARAETEIKRVGGYIYFKTPFTDLLVHERESVVKRSMQMLVSTLETNLPKIDPSSKKFGPEAAASLDKACGKVDEVVLRLRDYISGTQQGPSPGLTAAVPSAIVVFLGGSFTAALKLSGGLTANIGVVLMPAKITQIDLLTQKQRSYYVIDTSWVALATLDTGVGVGGGTKLRVGAGLIWGPLRSASDFRGAGVAGSGTFMVLGQGVNVQGGILNQWGSYGPKRSFSPFLLAAWEGGAAATVSLHATLSAVLPLGNFIRGAFYSNGGDQMLLDDRDGMGEDPQGGYGGGGSGWGGGGIYNSGYGSGMNCGGASVFSSWNTPGSTPPSFSNPGSTPSPPGNAWDEWTGKTPIPIPSPSSVAAPAPSASPATGWNGDDFMKGWNEPAPIPPAPSPSPAPTLNGWS